MPRSQANLQFGMLRGLHGCTRDEKLLYVAILLEPTVNQAGVGARRVSRWAREAEMTEAEVEKALAGLDEKRYVIVDEDTDEILVRTIIRRDGVAEKPNMLWAAVRQAVLVESPRLRKVLADELRKLPPAPPPKQLANGKTFVYADPHAIADELDPQPPEPARQPVDNPGGEHSENPSGTLPEPFANRPAENGSRTYPRTPGGGGGGGGGGNCPVGGPVGEARAARSTTTPDLQPEERPGLDSRLVALPGGLPAEPPRCPRNHAVDKPCRACQALREQWERDTAAAEAEHARAGRQRAAEARAACPRCDEVGWLVDDAGIPVEPAVRCDHRPGLRAVGT